MNKYIRCPKCAEEGRDRRGNNLVEYSDGWQICYAGHGVLSKGEPNSVSFFHKKTGPSYTTLSQDIVNGIEDLSDSRLLSFLWQYDLRFYDAFGIKQIINGSIVRAYEVSGSATDNQRAVEFPVDLGMIIPVSGIFGDDFIIRRIGDLDAGKKSYSSRGSRHFEALHQSTDVLCVVEDCFSAMKIHQAGFSAIALLGTNMKQETFIRILQLMESDPIVLVWLDGDQAGIEGSKVILDRIKGFADQVTTVSTEKDPKWLSEREIQEEVLNCYK